MFVSICFVCVAMIVCTVVSRLFASCLCHIVMHCCLVPMSCHVFGMHLCFFVLLLFVFVVVGCSVLLFFFFLFFLFCVCVLCLCSDIYVCVCVVVWLLFCLCMLRLLIVGCV